MQYSSSLTVYAGLTFTNISPAFDCRQMVANYRTELYDPANQQHQRLRAGGYEQIREKASWNSRIREVWDRVRFVESGPAPALSLTSGSPVQVRTAIDLAELWASQGLPAKAAALLRPIFELFEEGFDTSDLKAAANLMESLG